MSKLSFQSIKYLWCFSLDHSAELTDWLTDWYCQAASAAWLKTSCNWLAPSFHRKEIEGVCFTFVMNGMKMSLLVDVRTLISSLTGVGGIIGICPWLQNYNDYMWHWSRLWLQARRTRPRRKRRATVLTQLNGCITFPYPIFFCSFTSLFVSTTLVLTKSFNSHSLHLSAKWANRWFILG